VSIAGGPVTDACAEGDLARVTALLAGRSNGHFSSDRALNSDVEDAMDVAVSSKHIEIVQYLLSQGAYPRTPHILSAIKLQSTPLLSALTSGGFDTNQPMNDSYPPPLS
jgi:ankyrin repeat protein